MPLVRNKNGKLKQSLSIWDGTSTYILLKVCYPEVWIKECQFVMKFFSGVMNTRFLSQNVLSCSAVFLK